MIIGRKEEKTILERVYKSKKAEFLVVYGRRRVGKTFLIRDFFSHKKCKFFHATGLKGGNIKIQLKKFTDALSQTFFDKTPLAVPKNWDGAFNLLHSQITKTDEKVVIFLDELPWLATRKSGLLNEIDYYWNRHWSDMPQVILIVCGSSASWLIQKIIYNKGGLHNRITGQIKLLPFSLIETNEYLVHKGIKLEKKHVLEIYMALGGIPYYLEYLEPGLSAYQNIQRTIFDDNAPLKDEYTKLFDSLFENADIYKELITLIAQKSIGVSKADLALKAELSKSGGRLSERLRDLRDAGFIEEFTPWGQKKSEYYKVIDEYTLFYLRWVEPHTGKKFPKDFWISESKRPAYYAWAGYAFEAVCMKHTHQIVQALKIPASAMGSWRFVPPKGSLENGAQVDLIIDRRDDALNLCEIKYTEQPFVIDKPCAERLRKVTDVFKEKTATKKQIFITIISANGLKKTMYSEEMISSVITLSDLFKEA